MKLNSAQNFGTVVKCHACSRRKSTSTNKWTYLRLLKHKIILQVYMSLWWQYYIYANKDIEFCDVAQDVHAYGFYFPLVMHVNCLI